MGESSSMEERRGKMKERLAGMKEKIKPAQVKIALQFTSRLDYPTKFKA